MRLQLQINHMKKSMEKENKEEEKFQEEVAEHENEISLLEGDIAKVQEVRTDNRY